MIITVSGPLGVGETGFVAALAERLGLPVLGREEVRRALGPEPLVAPAGDSDEADETVATEAGWRGWFGGDRRLGAALADKLLGLVANRSVILVGWAGADILRAHPATLHLGLVADRAERLRRLCARTDSEPATAERLLADSDAHRAEFHRRLFGTDWTDPRRQHLTLNLSRLTLPEAVALAARFARLIEPATPIPSGGRSWRYLTISRQFGAGGAELAEQLASRLGWTLGDRELLHQSGALGGLATPRLIQLDERGPEFLERLSLLQESAAYFDGLRAALAELVARGPAVLVGRGANLLVTDEAALHLRLVATDDDRLERVMRRRWLAAPAATALIEREDRARAEFHRHFFRVEWADPTLYHVTCTSSRLPLPALADALAGFLKDA